MHLNGHTIRIIFAAALFAALAMRLTLAFVPGYIGDQSSWALLSQYVSLHGWINTYSLTISQPELGIYPPLYHLLLNLVGVTYQQFFSPAFAIDSSLYFLLKLVPILGDALIGLALYVVGRRLINPSVGCCIALAFLINPAII
jgi:asparagine N-glycosylation enzyme membrane subunit Stt3